MFFFILGYTPYEFRVRALTGATPLVGSESLPSYLATTTAPLPPVQIDVSTVAFSNIDADRMNVTWTVPRHNGDLITKYVIRSQLYRDSEFAIGIAAQDITQSVGVTVTQGSNTGTLKTALSGSGMTSIIVTATYGVSFITTADILIGTGGTQTTVAHGNINTVTTTTSATALTPLTTYDSNLSPFDQLSFSLINLQEKTNYRIAITTYNSFGSQTETTTSAWATTLSATIPGRIHSVPKVQTTTATTATVAFVAPDMGGVPILGYTCLIIPTNYGPTATPLSEWTLTITSQSIAATAGTAITQGSGESVVEGTLKTTLNGATTTVVVTTAVGATLSTSTDVIIGTGGSAITIAHATITASTSGTFKNWKN